METNEQLWVDYNRDVEVVQFSIVDEPEVQAPSYVEQPELLSDPLDTPRNAEQLAGVDTQTYVERTDGFYAAGTDEEGNLFDGFRLELASPDQQRALAGALAGESVTVEVLTPFGSETTEVWSIQTYSLGASTAEGERCITLRSTTEEREVIPYEEIDSAEDSMPIESLPDTSPESPPDTSGDIEFILVEPSSGGGDYIGAPREASDTVEIHIVDDADVTALEQVFTPAPQVETQSYDDPTWAVESETETVNSSDFVESPVQLAPELSVETEMTETADTPIVTLIEAIVEDTEPAALPALAEIKELQLVELSSAAMDHTQSDPSPLAKEAESHVQQTSELYAQPAEELPQVEEIIAPAETTAEIQSVELPHSDTRATSEPAPVVEQTVVQNESAATFLPEEEHVETQHFTAAEVTINTDMQEQFDPRAIEPLPAEKVPNHRETPEQLRQTDAYFAATIASHESPHASIATKAETGTKTSAWEQYGRKTEPRAITEDSQLEADTDQHGDLVFSFAAPSSKRRTTAAHADRVRV